MAAYTTIDDPSAYFQTAIYTGNGGTIDVVNDGNSDLQPDWLWFKCRSHNTDHGLQDSVRGASLALQSNTGGADGDVGTSQITAFGSDGFSLASGGDVNTNSRTYVCWQWKTGTSFSNDASSTGIGTIDSAGSVNQDAGFSIVSYTGNSPNATTIKHGLNSIPQMIIFKRLVGVGNFTVYHQSLGNTKGIFLTTTAASDTDSGYFNNTTPTSSVFSVANSGDTNSNGNAMIAYCFAEKTGYSKFGSYTGNGNADGAFVNTGFKPAFLLVKRSSQANNDWNLHNNKSPGFNVNNSYLAPNDTAAEVTGNTSQIFDLLSNGFKCRGAGTGSNASGSTYIYMAFAENPFVASNFNAATAR